MTIHGEHLNIYSILRFLMKSKYYFFYIFDSLFFKVFQYIKIYRLIVYQWSILRLIILN